MTATYLKPPTRFPRDPGMAKSIKNSLYMAKGPTISVGDTTVIDLFTVPANTFISEIIVRKVTAWDATTAATMTIGDSDDADRFMAASDADIQNLGLRSSKQDDGSNQLGAGGWFYTSAGVIQATLTNEDASTGSLEVYCLYKSYSNEF